MSEFECDTGDGHIVERPDSKPVRVNVRQLATVASWLIAVFLFVWFFNAAKIMFLGFLAAAALAAALSPFVQRLPGPHGLVALLIGVAPPLLFAGLVALIVWFAAEPIKRQLNYLPEMEQQLNASLADFSLRLGLVEPVTVQSLASQMLDVVTGARGAKLFSTTAGFFSDVFIALAFIFIGCIYMLISPPDRVFMPALRLLPVHWRSSVKDAVEELGPRLRWWLIGTVISAVTIGLAAWIGYTIVGLQFTVPLAILAALGEFIPTIGPLLTFAVALIFAATQGVGTVVGVSVVYLIIQTIEGYVLLPIIMKRAVNIPPIITLFSIVFWGSIFGVPGVLLALPLDLLAWSFAKHLIMFRMD